MLTHKFTEVQSLIKLATYLTSNFKQSFYHLIGCTKTV